METQQIKRNEIVKKQSEEKRNEIFLRSAEMLSLDVAFDISETMAIKRRPAGT